MSRPRKCRTVCHYPQSLSFAPTDSIWKKSTVILSIDEYETIRLIDKNGLSQEQCGNQMNIARTTVQQIYASARKKIANALVDGLPLRIDGGDFHLCDGTASRPGCKDCFKYRINRQYVPEKGSYTMRIAVTYENGQIYQHFGHTKEFKVYNIQDGKVVSSEIIDTNGSGHGALAGVLTALKVDTLICGGIGGGALAALNATGIKLYGGASGDADDAVNALLAGNLSYNPDVHCDHHGEHHHEHSCGEHHHGSSCGEQHCKSHS